MDCKKIDLKEDPLNCLGSYFSDLVVVEEGLWDAQWERRWELGLVRSWNNLDSVTLNYRMYTMDVVTDRDSARTTMYTSPLTSETPYLIERPFEFEILFGTLSLTGKGIQRCCLMQI
jgi:hypothetical protein